MFRIIDRRIRSASSKIEKLENSAEIALAKAHSQAATAARSLSLRARSRPRTATTGSEGGEGGDANQKHQQNNDSNNNNNTMASSGGSGSLLNLLSPRKWTATATTAATSAWMNSSKNNNNNKSGGERMATDRPLAAAASPMHNTSSSEEQQQQQQSEEIDGALMPTSEETMNYVEVQNTDTLEGIAAAHDCTVGELVKLNKLTSRMVFPGQKLLVPAPEQHDLVITNGKLDNKFSGEKCSGIIHKGPGHAVPIPPNCIEETTKRIGGKNLFMLSESNDSTTQSVHLKAASIERRRSKTTELGRMASELDPDDQECLQRFLKIRVKQVTESDGTVVGTLLVTPNCLMFDPDIDHPLVQEKGGPDLYGMVANMEDIVSVTVYKDIGSLTGEKRNKEDDIFDPKRVTGSPKKLAQRAQSVSSGSRPQSKEGTPEKRRQSDAKFIPRRSAENDQVLGYDGDQTLVFGTSASGLLLSSMDTSNNSTNINRHGSTGEESNLSNSEQQLPSIDEEREILHKKHSVSEEHYSHDKAKDLKILDMRQEQDNKAFEMEMKKKMGEECTNLQTDEEKKRAHFDLEQANSLDVNHGAGHLTSQQQRRSTSPLSRYSQGIARNSFGKLGRTLSAKATSFKGTVQSGAQTVATGTQKMAHGVVTHTLSAADHIQTGIQNSAKVVASVPGSIVNVSAGLLQEGQNGVMEVVDTLKKEVMGEGNNNNSNNNKINIDLSPQKQLPSHDKQQDPQAAMKRERSLATLETLCQRTQQAREQAVQRAFDTGFVLGSEEIPALDNGAGDDGNERPIGTPPEPPYYMIVRVDRRKKRKKSQFVANPDQSTKESSITSADFLEEGCNFGNKRKREFWYAVPRNRVDAIYQFLLQWSPQKYGQVRASTADETNIIENTANENSSKLIGKESVTEMLTTTPGATPNFGAFVVLDKEVDETLTGEKPSDHFGKLDREWEVVTVRELCRRLSLEDSLEPSELPLPEGSLRSQILDEFMIRQIVDILPPRAEGYPWVNIYNSEKHGFSLSTLYRKMSEWREEMSPVLLVIRDVGGHVFGAVTSSALHPADHYYGTGDSCLLFRFTGEYPHTRELRTYNWTGENQFFVNATKEFLSVGAGGGHYGLWLDADLNHGRSQKCSTFHNEPLAGGLNEDFVIQFVEAFGFSMT